jgi:Uma2 family endonuclease
VDTETAALPALRSFATVGVMAQGSSSLRSTRKFSVDDVMHMLEAGVLNEDEPLELLEGDLVVVSPQSPIHSSLTVRLRKILEDAYGASFHVRDHSPVQASPNSLPEPDLAVVRGSPEEYLQALPQARHVPLVVDVSVSTRTVDRNKARVYAAAGYPVYWIVDVESRRLETRSGPTPDAQYVVTQLVDEDGSVLLPETRATVLVRSLLP